jgi:hypothetical protein
VRIAKHDVGHNRWHLTAHGSNRTENRLFREWMREHYPSCLCVQRDYHGTGPAYWEVRGSDPADQMMIIMRWS